VLRTRRSEKRWQFLSECAKALDRLVEIDDACAECFLQIAGDVPTLLMKFNELRVGDLLTE